MYHGHKEIDEIKCPAGKVGKVVIDWLTCNVAQAEAAMNDGCGLEVLKTFPGRQGEGFMLAVRNAIASCILPTEVLKAARDEAEDSSQVVLWSQAARAMRMLDFGRRLRVVDKSPVMKGGS